MDKYLLAGEREEKDDGLKRRITAAIGGGNCSKGVKAFELGRPVGNGKRKAPGEYAFLIALGGSSRSH